MGKYQGKTAVITGGTSGIGLATARILVAEGAKVVVTGRDPQVVEAAGRELGSAALALVSDAGSLAAIDVLAARTQGHLGAVDLLFFNAGIGKFAPLADVTESFWDEIMAINTKGAFFTVQRLAPLLRSGGSVVLNTSVADVKGMASASVYSASKAALRSLARSLATELLPQGVRVNAVSPGPITTPILNKAGLPAEAIASFRAQMTEQNPMKRFGTAEEVARAALFLAFEATYSTGAEFVVDGGSSQL